VRQLAHADRRESCEAMCETVRTITELVEQLDRRFIGSSGIPAVDGG
jgi:hypothetical protein